MTDANLLLGYLAPDAPLAGGVELDHTSAHAAVARLAGELGFDVRECAEGIVRIAGVEMARALRVVTVERGVDPRGFSLLAFGGAGPLHATQVADELGLDRVLCPRASGVLAALGLVVSPRRRDAQSSVLLSGAELTATRVAEIAGALGEQARTALGEPDAELRATYELRYRGQSFELAVPMGVSPSIAELRTGFEDLHEERYGYHDAEQEIELVTVRISAVSKPPEVSLASGGDARDRAGHGDAPGEPRRGRRRVIIGGAELELGVLRGTPAPGSELAGPLIVELPESTLLVAPGWLGTVDTAGTIVLDRA